MRSYELGLRHAMKPKSTIILCEEITICNIHFDISMSPSVKYYRMKNYRKSVQEQLEKNSNSLLNLTRIH